MGSSAENKICGKWQHNLHYFDSLVLLKLQVRKRNKRRRIVLSGIQAQDSAEGINTHDILEHIWYCCPYRLYQGYRNDLFKKNWGSSSRVYYPIDTLSNARKKGRFPQLKSRFEPGTAKIVSLLPMDIYHMKYIDDIIR